MKKTYLAGQRYMEGATADVEDRLNNEKMAER